MKSFPIDTDPANISEACLGVCDRSVKADAEANVNVNAVKAPVRRSFEEFLLNDARVPVGRGVYEPYSFAGREPLLAVVRVIDRVLGSSSSSCSCSSSPSPFPKKPETMRMNREDDSQIPATPLPDAEISLAGGAQFGKTLLELNLAAYLTGQQFRNFGLYLPDDDLVEGIVDSKFRPDVVDQIDWFAKMTQVGKALNRSGKAVNRKGAFLVTDGRRKATGVVRGLGKVPTAFSMDVAAMDELDDLQPRRMKFVRGRLAASDLRFILKLGTQRIHGRGMNLAWKDGSQGVFALVCPACGRMHNAEEEFPGIVRMHPVGRVPSPGVGLANHDANAGLGSAGSGDPAYKAKSDVPNPQRPDRPATGVSSSASCLRSAASWDNSRSNTERDDPSPGRLQGKRDTERGSVTRSSSARPKPCEINSSALQFERCCGSQTRAPQNLKLTWSGDFKVDGDEVAFAHEPGNQYYLGCVECGAELDRRRPIEEHRRPALIRQRKWSFRISQLAIAAIDLSQIVGRFQDAVADAEEMAVFRCDVLALPQSTSQSLTPAVLDRARAVEPYELSPAPRVREGGVAFGGLDMGDRCWLYAREVSPIGGQDAHATTETHRFSIFHTLSSSGIPQTKTPTPGQGTRPTTDPHGGMGTTPHVVAYNRLLAAQKIPAGDVMAQAVAQFYELGLTALFIDERPLVNEARAIALALNGLQSLEHWPRINNPNSDWIELPGGLTWDGRQSRWLNLKCALVRFTKTKLGSGLEHTMVFFEEGGQTKFVPCIACNRFETIDRVVREFLTPAEGVVQLAAPQGSSSSSSSSSNSIRQTPAMWLPRRAPGQPPILDLVDSHFITGSERIKEPDGSLGDYADGCENHLLLANAYSALASIVCVGKPEVQSMSPYFPSSYIRSELGWRADRCLEG